MIYIFGNALMILTMIYLELYMKSCCYTVSLACNLFYCIPIMPCLPTGQGHTDATLLPWHDWLACPSCLNYVNCGCPFSGWIVDLGNCEYSFTIWKESFGELVLKMIHCKQIWQPLFVVCNYPAVSWSLHFTGSIDAFVHCSMTKTTGHTKCA